MTTGKITDLYAVIYTPTGTALGTVSSIQEHHYTEVLDGAGEYDYVCPASSANGSLLSEGRRADVYAALYGGKAEVELMSSGAITAIEPTFNLGATCYLVGGRDRIGELADRLIPSLDVVELGWTYLNDGKGCVSWLRPGTAPYYTYYDWDLGPAYDGTLTTWGATNNGSEEIYLHSPLEGMPSSETATWLYVGYDSRFDAAYFSFADGSVNIRAATMQAQYYDGSGWTTITVDDGTSSGGATWGQSGTVTWTRPSDWERYTGIGSMGNWYWMRFRTAYGDNETYTNYVRLGEVMINADVPTTNGLNLIMAYAPSGWKTSGYAATAGTAFGQITDYTVLQALGWLREQAGGHFRASLASGTMYIDWLETFTDNYLTADGSGATL